MHPDRPTPAASKPLDDETLAAIVQDVVDDWRMPPQRLDEVTWRDRVDRSRGWSNRSGSGLGWSRRLLAAAAVAVVATVSLSLAAVWLTAPRPDQVAVQSSSPGPASPAPTRSAPAAASPLPKLVQQGELPTPSKVMVEVGGTYRLVDLSTGTLGPQILQSNIGPSTVLARPGGGWLCICGTGGSPQGVSLSLLTIDANGVSLDAPSSNGIIDPAHRLKDIQGTFDPNESEALQPQIADATVTSTPDGRYALIGWVYRDGAAGWVIGVDVLDRATLQITNSRQLTLDEPVSVNGRARVRTAPVASVSTDGSTILLSSFWYLDDPNDVSPVGGTDHWMGLFVDGVIGFDKAQPAVTAAGSTASANCLELEAYPIDKGTYYTLCRAPSESAPDKVARVGAEGTIVDTTELPTPQGVIVTTRTADALFVWSPEARTMARFDFDTAAVTTGHGQTASAPSGLVDQLAALGRSVGHLIAPTVLAKGLFDSSIVASPDGRRIFAVVMELKASEVRSRGIDVFDADSLDSIGHWEATGNIASIAINADGTGVYASAPGGVPGSPVNGASITVFDSADGHVRLLAGQLGQPGTSDLRFTEPVLR